MESHISSDVTAPLPVLGQVGKPPGGHPRRMARMQRLGVLLVALAAVGGLLFAFTPHATIVVTPAARTLERTLSIPLRSVGEQEGVLQRPLEVTVEVRRSFPATGRRVEGAVVAGGTVLFFNETNREIAVPAGTLLATEGGQLFQTAAQVRVPPLKPEFFMEVAVGMQAGKAEAPVKANKAGSSGNVAAGRIRTLPKGPAGLKVINPEPIHGGTDRTIAYVTERDIAQARRSMESALEARAEAALVEKAGAGAYVLRSLVSVQEIAFQAQPGVLKDGESLSVVLRGVARGEYVLLDEVQRVARNEAEQAIPPGYQLLALPGVALEGEVAATGTGEMRRALAVSASIVVGGTLDPVAIARLVAGMSPEQARTVLLESGEVGGMELRGGPRKYLPRWTPWIRVVVGGFRQQ